MYIPGGGGGGGGGGPCILYTVEPLNGDTLK